ncbi:hypothetical protein LDENG_00294920 [Lucifuga dentata]|nr:hypothetical protein LDENG_00294920 [Lucifuga dentata]
MSSTSELQIVQNAAAGVLTNTRKFDSITPVLLSLHWLPVHARCSMFPNTGLLSVPRVKKKSAGSQAFSHRAPVLWNSLPVEIRQSNSIDFFKSKLKTYLFTLYFNS